MVQTEKLKRSTVCLEPELHKALRLHSLESGSSVSEIINDAVRDALQEDLEDLQVCEERSTEKMVSYETMLKRHKLDGKKK